MSRSSVVLSSTRMQPHHNFVLGSAGSERELRGYGFELVPLRLGEKLVGAGQVATHAYFPLRGVISVLSATADGNTVEVAAIGRQGMAASALTLDPVPSPFYLLVEVPGRALRIDRAALHEHIRDLPDIERRMCRFLDAVIAEMAQSSVCNRYHTSQQRLARWLLTVSNRAESDTLPITHEFAAMLVGGGRPRVTAAFHSLATTGLIRHRRGEIAILDRAGLERASCECYAAVNSFFTALQ